MVVHTGNNGGKPLRKSFRVFTNDPAQPRIELIVSGKVMTFAEIDPAYVRLNGGQGELLSATVNILPRKGYPFEVKDVSVSGDKSIQVALHPLGKNPIQDGYQLEVTSKKSEVGTFRGSIVVQTDSKQKPKFYIPVSGRIQHQAPDKPKSSIAQ